ncbi:MAG TPA: aminotransferase class III-fold pyridoxal phosphate-dependent enzyme, partial [Chondromyces sp.]|nr:aminotransferase class III-fold pyridoxal phosphate-dependent enzyme [Chondromyces sp.]
SLKYKLTGTTPSSIEILYFESCFGSSRGALSGMCFVEEHRKYGVQLDHLKIPSPHYWKNPFSTLLNQSEMNKLQTLEEEAIQLIVEKISSYPSIGALLIEPIVGPYGVYFYQPKFLLQLRELCTSKSLLLIADETLTIGRTGKFFGYQHYKDFEPDFIIFGKGIGLSGLASCGKWREDYNLNIWNQTTVQAGAIELLRSALILNRIADDGLMDNIAATGSYLVNKLNELSRQKGEAKARGIGGLIYAQAIKIPLNTAHFRLLPPLTLTIQQVDKLLTSMDFPQQDICNECHNGGDVLLCDSCPRVFHLKCIGLSEVPEGIWECNQCKS